MNDATHPEIILASSSPRRRDLLRLLGFPFRIVVPDADESVHPGEGPAAYAARTALAKAECVAGATPDRPAGIVVIGADTVVTLGGAILGKPRDAADAARMLRALGGRRHEVMTGLAVVGRRPGAPQRTETALVRTGVEMKPLTEPEIAAYVAGGEPMDKAGAYGIQGGAAALVRAVYGSYTNVVGLPLAELHELLVGRFGFPPAVLP
jgi:septum formation protein